MFDPFFNLFGRAPVQPKRKAMSNVPGSQVHAPPRGHGLGHAAHASHHGDFGDDAIDEPNFDLGARTVGFHDQDIAFDFDADPLSLGMRG